MNITNKQQSAQTRLHTITGEEYICIYIYICMSDIYGRLDIANITQNIYLCIYFHSSKITTCSDEFFHNTSINLSNDFESLTNKYLKI